MARETVHEQKCHHQLMDELLLHTRDTLPVCD